MIRLLKRIVLWLESRFPEKVIVTAEDYNNVRTNLSAHDTELADLREQLKIASSSIEVLVSRVGTLETSAVHKGAVADLVTVVKSVKDDFTSLKVSLGMNRVVNSDIQAMLNGEVIDNG